MRPFLRWAGGKRWLLARHLFHMPENARLIDPFAGGGALFFSSKWSGAILGDINPYLINSYVAMRDHHDDLFRLVCLNFQNHCSEHYYYVRKRLEFQTIQGAADFIYLNRSCFNGLFRVNLAGKFNVPVGDRAYKLDNFDEFSSWSSALCGVDIRLTDFEELVDLAGSGDFIFADPPYTVNHNQNGFIEYNEKIFRWADQIRLKDAIVRASKRGAKFVITNADHESVRTLYEGFNLISVGRGSEMAGKISARRQTSELIVTG